MNPSLDPHLPLSRLPVFPLPQSVFFPGTPLPLHVFEPRYRQMIEDTLKGDRLLAVVLLAPGWEPHYHSFPPLYPIATVGRIIHEQRMEDGRWNILLRGLARVRLETEIPSGTPYRTFSARILEDKEGAGTTHLETDLATLRHLFLQAVSFKGEEGEKAASLLTSPGSPGSVTDRLAAVLPLSPQDKQRVLECLDVPLRVRTLIDLLAEEVDHFGLGDEEASEPGVNGDGDVH